MYAGKRFQMVQKLLGTLGLEPKRVRFAHISSAEGTVFAKLVDEYVEELRALGPNPLKVMSDAKIRCS
jgi:coenzyme F420-reducing hydrogenase delta subunit